LEEWTVDLKNRKIRVNAVSPGLISTPMLSGQGMGLSEEQVEQFKKSALNSVPLGRVGNPDEIARAVALHPMTAVISQVSNYSSMEV
jgi:NAD(P)-dependent dehydrogenase (short-subunit alcohol dehydrogenase family)